jgi:hypothetical protein
MPSFGEHRRSLSASVTRREVLRAGSLAPLGLGLLEVLAPRAAAAPQGRAKSVILLFMWGGPSRLDTWDPKPDAPPEVRGHFQSIPTTVPGLRIGEHFPLLAARAEQYAVVRSMTHTDPAHLSPVHHLMTGRVAAKPNSDADGASRADSPCIGSVIQKLAPPPGAVPAAVTLPWAVSHPSAPGGTAPGQNGGWLGAAYDPFLVTGNPDSPSFAVPGLSAPGDAERLKGRAELSRAATGVGGRERPAEAAGGRVGPGQATPPGGLGERSDPGRQAASGPVPGRGARLSHQFRPARRADEGRRHAAIRAVVRKHPRFGYRRVWAVLRADG